MIYHIGHVVDEGYTNIEQFFGKMICIKKGDPKVTFLPVVPPGLEPGTL